MFLVHTKFIDSANRRKILEIWYAQLIVTCNILQYIYTYTPHTYMPSSQTVLLLLHQSVPNWNPSTVNQRESMPLTTLASQNVHVHVKHY